MPISKDQNHHTQVPTAWKNTFKAIVEALKDEDSQLGLKTHNIRPVNEKDMVRITNNIQAYGDRLVNLPSETWSTSVCQWMLDYWEVSIDLFTVNESPSDLVLAVRVYEDGTSYLFEVQDVYVP